MQTNILWSGVEYNSLENCLINTDENQITVTSTIVGAYRNTLYLAGYQLQSGQFWQVYHCTVNCKCDDEIQTFEIVRNQDRWSVNGQYHPEFDGCTDVDIPLTPFTNSLPVNRLRMKENQEEIIEVIYIDLLEKRISRVRQKYKRISQDTYKYENIPNDFEAEIKVDEDGFVVHYPQLFTRDKRISSNYP